jgi:two-component system, NarL family, sensor histidine kinase EvgS
VLSDVHMPVMDGYELAAEIRAEEAREGLPRTPLIALTAAVLKGEAERCIEAGMDDYIAKPASIDTLLRHLCHWLPHLTGPTSPPVRKASTASRVPTAASDDTPATFDPQPLRAALGEDPALLRQVLEEFIEAATLDVEAVEAAWRRDDRPVIVRETHRLQAAAALAGAEALGVQALALERGAAAMPADALELAVARLQLRLAEFSEATAALRLAPREPDA